MMFAFEDGALEVSWWEAEVLQKITKDDSTDTLMFTIGTIATLVKVLLAPNPPTRLLLVMVALSLLCSLSHVVLLRMPRPIYLRYRDTWAVSARIIRPLFALYSTPHLDPFAEGSTLRAIFRLLLSTGIIPLTCAIGIRLRLRHHLLIQAVIVCFYLQQVPGTCMHHLAFPAAHSLLQLLVQLLLMVCVGPALDLPSPDAPDPCGCCLALHGLLILLNGYVNTSVTVYRQELRSRSAYLARLATLAAQDPPLPPRPPAPPLPPGAPSTAAPPAPGAAAPAPPPATLPGRLFMASIGRRLWRRTAVPAAAGPHPAADGR